jgi:osmoprotectant transport system permease protein
VTSTHKTPREKKTEERTKQEEGRPEVSGGSKSEAPSADLGALRKVVRYLPMPLFLGLVCLALYLWVSSLELDAIEARTINQEYIIARMMEHLWLTGAATVVIVVLAVTFGVMLTRPVMGRVAPTIASIAALGQATPSIGVLVLIAILLGRFGFNAALFGLVIYAFLPVLRNTMVGFQQVDKSVIEAGRGMGMTKTAVLFRIELPLAIPVMLAGIRTALIIVVGTATVATFINAGGMGDMITNGIKLRREPVLITSAVLTAVLALSIDYLAGIAEDILRPKGL